MFGPSRTKKLEADLRQLKGDIYRAKGIVNPNVGQVVDHESGVVIVPGNPDLPPIRIAFIPEGLFLDGKGWLRPAVEMWAKLGVERPFWEYDEKTKELKEQPTARLAPRGAHVIMGECFRGLFSNKRHRFKVAKSGRGAGKSFAIAIALVLMSRAYSLRVMCVRQYQNSIDSSSMKLLTDQIKKLGLSDEFTITNNEIIHKDTGSEFTFKGLDRNVDTVKSRAGLTHVWIEEAASIIQLAWDTLEPTVREDNSEIIASYNPEKATDPIHAHFFGENPTTEPTVYIDISYRSNPWFFKGTMPATMEHHSRGKRARFNFIWMGAFYVISEAAIFPDIRQGRVNLSDESAGWVRTQGIDFSHGGKDPFFYIEAWVSLKLNQIYISNEYKTSASLVDLPGELATVPRIKSTVLYSDSSNPGIEGYLNNFGFPAQGAKKGAGSITMGLSWLQGFDIVVSPVCVDFWEEIRQYTWKQDRKTGVFLPEPIDNFNHGADALRYATSRIMADSFGSNDNNDPGFVRLKMGARR